MKKQTGIWVDRQVWMAYRDLCSSEKLRPAEPIEEYVKFILRNGSAVAVLNMMQGMEKARSEGLEAYARVLLHWYVNGRRWVADSAYNDYLIEPMLLHVLKDVGDSQLRREIEEALKVKPRKRARKRKAEKTVTMQFEIEGEEDEEAEDSEASTEKALSFDEMQKKLDELKKAAKAGRRRRN